ncbi:MAG: hypothetical protein EZS28_049435, partial [Streblomastix strix]
MDFCNQEIGRRIEENNGLLATEHAIESPTFYNERSEQGTGNMEQRRLGLTDGQQISVQSCSSNWESREIHGFHAQGHTVYASGNVFLNLKSTENLCKGNLNNNRQSEKQEPSTNKQFCCRHSVSDAGLTITGERNRVDNIGVQEIWMDNQREQKQVETRIAIFVPGIDVQLSDNENSIDQRQEKGVESTGSKLHKVYYGIKTAKDQKHN